MEQGAGALGVGGLGDDGECWAGVGVLAGSIDGVDMSLRFLDDWELELWNGGGIVWRDSIGS